MKNILSESRLLDLLAACPSLRVGVLGDFVLDAYFCADMTRAELSREAPLFNRPVVSESYSAGGAANVACNLRDLGCGTVSAFTVFGDDWRGALLKDQLAGHGVDLARTLTHPEWKTPLFGKVILTSAEHQQEDPRLDFVNTRPLPADVENDLLARLEDHLPDLDALVIADYLPCGVLTAGLRANLSGLANRYSRVFFVADARREIAAFQGMVLKPNELEALRAVYPEREPGELSLDDLSAVGRTLQAGAGRTVYLTLGPRGCLLVDARGEHHLPAVASPAPVDPVGAGDTFLSAVAGGLAAGGSPLEAGALATLAAGVTVRKLRTTGTASPEELLALHRELA